MSHPVRRRICRLLMLLGTVGFTSVVATLIMTIMVTTADDWFERLGAVVLGVLALFLVAKMRFVNVLLTLVIRWALKKWTRLEVKDYEQILHVARGYSISQILVEPGEWLANQTLRKLALTSEGVIVLSILRQDGTVLGTPSPDAILRPGDKLICYGREENLANLAEREIGRTGDLAHEEMALAHKRSQTAETILDTEGKKAAQDDL